MRTRNHLPSLTAAAVSFLLVACASSADPPTVDPTLLPGTSAVRPVDADALVEETTDGRLADVLGEADFSGGTERTWTDRQSDVWRTVVRALRFGSPDGAHAYLAWLEANASRVIGPATRQGEGSPLAFEHHPDDCCPNKDGPQALAASADGDVVWVVTVAGPAADAARAIALLPGAGT